MTAPTDTVTATTSPDPNSGSGTDGPLAHLLVRFDAFDDRVDRAVEPLRTPTLDPLMYALSSAADHSLVWHAIGAVQSARAGSLAPMTRLSKILGIESAITNGPVKALFRRDRPERDDVPGEALPYGLRVPITSSFPSGHATAAFCAAAVLSQHGGAKFWYPLAAVVASTRVYVRMHHASDVLAGAAFGVALGQVLRRVVR